jgi:hypothetical protein
MAVSTDALVLYHVFFKLFTSLKFSVTVHATKWGIHYVINISRISIAHSVRNYEINYKTIYCLSLIVSIIISSDL